ncbi:hypothetical protein ACFQ9R_28835 [Nocardia sp. NPDC056541]|uniref:hypothetical protein n=1 Tax=Nocardia sp. NPDC056541 TaxID=3345860 RepID=UPI00366D4008
MKLENEWRQTVLEGKAACVVSSAGTGRVAIPLIEQHGVHVPKMFWRNAFSSHESIQSDRVSTTRCRRTPDLDPVTTTERAP